MPRGINRGRQIWLGPPDGPAPSASLLQPVRNRKYPHNKPEAFTGLWTSSWCGRNRICDWWEWCHKEEWGPAEVDVYDLHPAAEARVFEVDSLDDLNTLIRRFPDRDPEWSRIYGEERRHVNWEAVATACEGVRLTAEGQWRTRLTTPDLYGWDCESTLWLRWAFDEVQYLGRRQRDRVLTSDTLPPSP